nr:hypothetical protein [Tanacetum cinerariifolium]GFB15757.1 hypothetical protein [Tanacetum cinerariifolium]
MSLPIIVKTLETTIEQQVALDEALVPNTKKLKDWEKQLQITLRHSIQGIHSASSKAKSPSDPSKAARTEAKQLKIVLRRSRQETHISQRGGSSTVEGSGVDAQDKDRNDDEGDKNDKSDDGKDDDDDDKDDA